ncbi:hypothetical protein TEQG_08732 [Trichophyton equinum CBS 127.97]|uniref:Uncharacterized protein n=1 Tax=Trichophyton equinum (strain ATCC MYA-4606 / CBS 127.97) TaxID=559882 RepID=F2PXP5_TRIEC|nr:hypothetical protein TEQG_08732 [Trichophyton equinum CBS 127.97]
MLVFKCKHAKCIVKAWCIRYQETRQQCPPHVTSTEETSGFCGKCNGKSLVPTRTLRQVNDQIYQAKWGG